MRAPGTLRRMATRGATEPRGGPGFILVYLFASQALMMMRTLISVGVILARRRHRGRDRPSRRTPRTRVSAGTGTRNHEAAPLLHGLVERQLGGDALKSLQRVLQRIGPHLALRSGLGPIRRRSTEPNVTGSKPVGRAHQASSKWEVCRDFPVLARHQSSRVTDHGGLATRFISDLLVISRSEQPRFPTWTTWVSRDVPAS